MPRDLAQDLADERLRYGNAEEVEHLLCDDAAMLLEHSTKHVVETWLRQRAAFDGVALLDFDAEELDEQGARNGASTTHSRAFPRRGLGATSTNLGSETILPRSPNA